MLDIRTEGRHPTGMDGFLNFVAQQALKEAFSAGENGEIPVAAAVFIPEEKKIIAMASNRTEQDNDPTAHAEILAVREACRILKAPRLPKCDIYVTLEPCPMCAGAIANARIDKVYYGADETNTNDNLAEQIFASTRLNHKVEMEKLNAYSDRCAQMLSAFFRSKR